MAKHLKFVKRSESRPGQTCPVAVQESRTSPVAVQEDKPLSAGHAVPTVDGINQDTPKGKYMENI